MASHYVYVNGSSTTIHCWSCPHCNDGKGQTDGLFIAAASYDEARAGAAVLGRICTIDCEDCAPKGYVVEYISYPTGDYPSERDEDERE